MTEVTRASQVFDKINNGIRNSEESLVNLLSAIAPYGASLIPAYMTYTHASDPDVLNFNIFMAWVLAGVVEILGLATVNTWFVFWMHNKRHGAKYKKMPLTVPVFAFIFYLSTILLTNVFLDAVELVSSLAYLEPYVKMVVRAFYTLLSIPAVLIMAVRTQHNALLREMDSSSVQKSSKIEQTLENSDENSKPIQNPSKQEKKMNKAELAYDFVNNFVNENREMPKTTMNLNGMEFSKTYLSYAINQYIVDNAQALLEDGVVDEARVEKALSKVEEQP